MLNNAKWIAAKQVDASKLHVPGAGEVVPENPKENWYPRNYVHQAFIDILARPGKPTDEQKIAASSVCCFIGQRTHLLSDQSADRHRVS